MVPDVDAAVASTAVRLDDFDYALPPERIAQHPIEPRDAARLLVDGGSADPPSTVTSRDLPELLGAGDLLVVNDSRVIPARLRLRRATGGAVEVLLLEALDDEHRTVGGAGPPGPQASRGASRCSARTGGRSSSSVPGPRPGTR